MGLVEALLYSTFLVVVVRSLCRHVICTCGMFCIVWKCLLQGLLAVPEPHCASSNKNDNHCPVCFSLQITCSTVGFVTCVGFAVLPLIFDCSASGSLFMRIGCFGPLRFPSCVAVL